MKQPGRPRSSARSPRRCGCRRSTRRACASCAATATALGYPSSFTIYDQADAVRLTGYVLRDLDLDAKRFPPRSVHAVISAAKNELHRRRDVRRAGRGRSSSARSPRSTASTRSACSRPAPWTSTTCSWSPSTCFRATPTCSSTTSSRFKHVLVDEYQDTNPVQNELVAACSPSEHRNVCVVGDSDQSHLPVPRRRHPQHPRVRGRLPRRHGDRARAELPVDPDDPRRRQRGHRQQPDAQAEGAVDRAGRRRAHHPLPRRGRARRGAAGSATRSARLHDDERLPLGRHRGLLPHQRAEPGARGAAHARRASRTRSSAAPASTTAREIKDALAYLRAVVNPADEVSLKRVLNVPKRGVGDTSVGRLDAWAGRPRRPVRRRAARRPSEAGRQRQGARRASRAARRCSTSCASSTPRRGPARRARARARRAPATSPSSRPSTPSRPQGRLENLAELVGVGPRVRDASTSSSRRSAWWPTPTSSTATRRRSCS